MSYTKSEIEGIMLKDLDKRYKLMLDCDLAAVEFPYRKLMNHMLQMIEKNRMFAIDALNELEALKSNLRSMIDEVYSPPSEEDDYFVMSDEDKLNYMKSQFKSMGLVSRNKSNDSNI